MEIRYEFFACQVPPQAAEIRQKVFIEEQGFCEEFDEIDKLATHLLIWKDGEAAATGRLFLQNGVWHIGRVAVVKEHRGCHLGEKVMELLCEKAKEKGAEQVEVSAQCRASGFYERIGFVPYGEIYLDEYCEHIAMTKKL